MRIDAIITWFASSLKEKSELLPISSGGQIAATLIIINVPAVAAAAAVSAALRSNAQNWRQNTSARRYRSAVGDKPVSVAACWIIHAIGIGKGVGVCPDRHFMLLIAVFTSSSCKSLLQAGIGQLPATTAVCLHEQTTSVQRRQPSDAVERLIWRQS